MPDKVRQSGERLTVCGSLTSPNNTLKVRDSYSAKEGKRVTLTPSSESTQTFAAAFEVLQVLSYGPGDVYLDIDSAAAIGGADDVLIEEGTSIPIPWLAPTSILLAAVLLLSSWWAIGRLSRHKGGDEEILSAASISDRKILTAKARLEDEAEIQKAAWRYPTTSARHGQVLISDLEGLAGVFATGYYGEEQVLIRDISSKGKASAATSGIWIEAIDYSNPYLNKPRFDQYARGRFVSANGYPAPIYEAVLQAPNDSQTYRSRLFGWEGVMYLATEVQAANRLTFYAWLHSLSMAEVSDTTVETVGGQDLITVHESTSDQWFVIGMSPHNLIRVDTAGFDAGSFVNLTDAISADKCYFCIGQEPMAFASNNESLICFAIGVDKAVTQAKVAAALNAGTETAYDAALAYWTGFFEGLREKWISVPATLRYKGYVALQQIAMATYNPDGDGAWMSAGPGTWYQNFIRDTAFCIKSLAKVQPALAGKMLDWFVNGPDPTEPIDGTNAYGIDGLEVGEYNNTDNAPTFLLAVGEYYAATKDLARMTALQDQIESALVYCQTYYVPADGQIEAKHPHDFGDDGEDVFPLADIKYESTIDILWIAGLEAIAPVFTALGDTANATYCTETATALRAHLEEFRQPSGLLTHSIKPDDSLQTVGYYGSSIIYDAWLLGNETSWEWMSKGSRYLGVMDSPLKYVLDVANLAADDNRGSSWAPFIGVVALVAAQHGDFEPSQFVADMFPGGPIPEWVKFYRRFTSSFTQTQITEITNALQALGLAEGLATRLRAILQESNVRMPGEGGTSPGAPEQSTHARSFPWAHASILELVQGLSELR